MELLTIHGPVRDPYLSEFSERYDLDSGSSVESTLPLHPAVELAADTRLRNNITKLMDLLTLSKQSYGPSFSIDTQENVKFPKH